MYLIPTGETLLTGGYAFRQEGTGIAPGDAAMKPGLWQIFFLKPVTKQVWLESGISVWAVKAGPTGMVL